MIADKRDVLSASQVGLIAAATAMGVSIGFIVKETVSVAGAAAWISVPLAAAGLFPVVLGLLIVNSWYPGQTIIQYLPKVLTAPLGWPIGLALNLYYLFFSATVLRSCTDIVKLFFLDKTPVEVVLITFLLVAAHLVLHGASAIGRFIQFTLPISLAGLGIVVGLSVIGGPRTQFGAILPFWAVSWNEFRDGVSTVFSEFTGWGVIAYLGAFLTRQRRGSHTQIAALTVLIPALLFIVLIIISLAIYGVEVSSHIHAPITTLGRIVELPGVFIERVDILLVMVWLLVYLVSVSVPLYCASLGMAHLFSLDDHRPWIYPMLPLIYMVAAFPSDSPSVELMRHGLRSATVTVTWLVPLTWLVAWLRRRKGGEGHADS